MSLTKPTVESTAKPGKVESSATSKTDRRRRKRAKMSSPVRVRLVDSASPFQEVCNTVDVSRDGILFASPHSGYWAGQRLEVTFPYSTAPSALNNPQAANVVRVFDLGGGLSGVGVQFASASASRGTNGASKGGTISQPAHTSQSVVVLVVESDASAADQLRNALQRDGYTIIVAGSTQAALDILKTTVPALLVASDNSNINGRDLCLAVKRNESSQHVPIVLRTNSEKLGDSRASQRGAVVSVVKSASLDRLLQMIRLLAPPPGKCSAYGAVQKDLERSL
ncbi:MAG: response regulator [Candidatus Acidiferrales bacterium]